MKKRSKKGLWIAIIAVVVVAALAFVGYDVYRHPARSRTLEDRSLQGTRLEAAKEEILSRPDIRVLVAYFSHSGTTRRVAEAIRDKTGGDLFEIAPQRAYGNVYTDANREIRAGERPPLMASVENMADYDVVFVGYPVWWHATPAPVNTFLESHDLAGKLVIPFCTSGESDVAETMPTFRQSCADLAVYGERRIGEIGQLDAWLADLGLTDALAKADAAQGDGGANEANADTADDSAVGANGDGGDTDSAGNTGSIGNTNGTGNADEPNSTGNADNTNAADGTAPASDAHTLVVYFSWSGAGNTEKMATYIQEQTGGDLLKLEPSQPYPTEYQACTEVALAERDENARPAIANLPQQLDGYDTIFVGYPIWNADLPMPLYTFFEEYDLSGKIVIPFVTHGGSGFSGTIRTIQSLGKL